ncbi:MAG TPA: hypothetical protein VGG57_12520 [Stellaceae bacterium]|jgi:hypothetical protein
MRGHYAGLVALCLYALAGLADTATHLRQPIEYGISRVAPGRVIAATDAGLFWPADLVAAVLLAQG